MLSHWTTDVASIDPPERLLQLINNSHPHGVVAEGLGAVRGGGEGSGKRGEGEAAAGHGDELAARDGSSSKFHRRYQLISC